MLAGAAYALDDASKDLLVLVTEDKIESRFEAAQSVALSGSSGLSKIISNLFSHSSFWHIGPLLILLSWALPSINFNGHKLFEVYAVLFLALVVFKPISRVRKITRVYGK